MRLSQDSIDKLKRLLKKHYGLDYDDEQAQDAGRAILRFVGLKLYQQMEMERKYGKQDSTTSKTK